MQNTKANWSNPIEVSDIDIAFSGSVNRLMPKYSEIPEAFRNDRGGKWAKFFSDMFYSGLKNVSLIPKDGIDAAKALRHMRCVAGSYEPKHEHKEAAVAYLMSLWFEDSSTWERAK